LAALIGKTFEHRRTVKAVQDKLSSVGRMYRFINEFNTHKIIEGSEGMRDWYKCNKKARKSLCRYDKKLYSTCDVSTLPWLFPPHKIPHRSILRYLDFTGFRCQTIACPDMGRYWQDKSSAH
jgi:hypothetical protein